MPKHEPEVIAAIRRRNRPRCGSRYLHCEGSHDAGDDTRILFECESCGSAAEFELAIINYKGNAFVEWREP